jgi:hypothetical protein
MLLRPPRIDSLPNGRVEVAIPEVVLPYDRQERDEWKKARCKVASRIDDRSHKRLECIPVDAGAMNGVLSALDLDGPTILNKARSAFYHQPDCHYCEMKLARHLVTDEGFLPSELFYENWRLSSDASAFTSRDVMQRTGAEQVQKLLGLPFLRAMSALIKRNEGTPVASFFPGENLAGKLPNHDSHVDIFGFSNARTKCAILEVKRGDGEKCAAHQLIFLAFAAYLLNARRSHLGLPVKLMADVGFVRYSSSVGEPRFYKITFDAA